MKKAFLIKYLELMFATASASLLVVELLGFLLKIPAIEKKFPGGLTFSGIGVVVPIIFLLFIIFGCFMIAGRWTASEKAGDANSSRWHNILQFIIAIEVAFISFIYVSFFLTVSMTYPTNSKDIPFFLQYPFMVWGVYIICWLPCVLVIIKKTRKMGARWCLIITLATLLRMVFDPNTSAPIGTYLFFCLFYFPSAILLMKDWNLLPMQPETSSEAV